MQKTGNIVKTKYESEFVQLHNNIARSSKLNLKEKGLLIVLLSLPEDWTIHISQLPQFCEEKKHAVRTAFKGLEEKGFILSVDMRDEKSGRFKGKNYIVYFESQTDDELTAKGSVSFANSPRTDFPDAVFPDAVNQTLQRKNATLINKEKPKQKNTVTKGDFDFFYFSVLARLEDGEIINQSEIPANVGNKLLKEGAIKLIGTQVAINRNNPT